MAYVTPGTVAAGDVATAAAWNVITNDVIQIATLAQGVFTNEAARDAAITSPTEGMIAYLTAPTVPAATGVITALPTGVRTIYNGSVWACVTPVGAGSSTQGSTTSTSFVTTLTSDSTAVSVTLVTGTTALVSLHGAAYISAAPPILGNLTVSVSGATTIAADGGRGAQTTITDSGMSAEMTRTQILTGLTAGTNTFTLNYRTSSGTLVLLAGRDLVVSGIA